MEKLEIFKFLLKKEHYSNYRHKITKDIFPEMLHPLYESLEETHSQGSVDVSLRELWAVHLIRYPTLTESKKNVLKSLFSKIHETEELSTELAEFVIDKILTEYKATRIAQAALEIAHGKTDDFSIIQGILDDNSNHHDVEIVTSDVRQLTEEIEASYKWSINLPELENAIGKIGPGLIILAGPVNSGKSCMGLSFTYGPNGFAEQGARCVYVGNEENRKRMMLRAISCYTGMSRDEITENPEYAQKVFEKIKGNTMMVLNSVTAFSELTHITHKFKPDCLIVDMLDKVQSSTSYRSDRHLQLGDIYARARDLADKYQCAIFGLSQTNGDSFGQLVIDQNQLAGSRVDKAANADLILTLGQLPSSDENNNFRQIYVAKTKSTGDKAKVTCNLIPHLSRIVS
jgi:archaellum biogenesis ATPase FlaH